MNPRLERESYQFEEGNQTYQQFLAAKKFSHLEKNLN
jgi:hypothetical protein